MALIEQEKGLVQPLDLGLLETVEENPQEIEGFSLEEFNKYRFEGLEIQQILFKEREPADVYGNVLSRYRLIMNDGSLRNVNFCEPRERLTDIPILETPALTTGSRGFNEDGQRMLGALGLPSILVGHEGEERDPWPQEIARVVLHPWKVIQELRNIHLARQAHVMVQVHKFINDWLVDTSPIDPDQAFLLGKSRGAMTNMWILAYSNMLEDGLKIPLGLNVATCFNQALNAKTRGETRTQPIKEVVHLGKMVVRKLAGVTTKSANTLNASPKSIVYEFAHIPTLVRADAGKAVPFINRKQLHIMMGFRDDKAGQNESWQETLADFENIIFKIVPGAHGAGIADVRTAAFIMRTFDMVVQQLQSGIPPDELDLSHLRQQVHRHLEAVA